MGSVSNANTPARPDDPIALSAAATGFPATGPWKVSAAAQVGSLGGFTTMKNLPNLAAKTTPLEVVLVSAAVGQPPIAREASPAVEAPAQ
jgi:hypothetical protein